MKYYLVSAEFISGEFGQLFRVAFRTRVNQDIDKRVQEYFRRYYGDIRLCEHEKGSNYYLYHGGVVGVKFHGHQEISKDSYEVFNRHCMVA